MGAMKDFILWCEENGYAEWNDFTDSYEYTTEYSQSELINMYIGERNATSE